MASNIISQVQQLFLPKKKSSPDGQSYTNTFNPSSTGTALGLPTYRDHLTDIFASRTSQDSRALLKDLVKFDSDVSATIHAYLTIANTTPRFYVYDQNNQLDLVGQQAVEALITSIVRRNDYTTGFSFTDSLRQIAEDFRYMVLLRGAVAAELIFNKLLLPSSIRHVDSATLTWFEDKPGKYKPQQRPTGAPEPISLDTPNFFVKMYRQNPTEIYPHSMFVSAINTIAARQQVINDLYRIMKNTGYPRIDITVTEEVLRKNVPAAIRDNEGETKQWINSRLSEISSQISNLRPDSAFVHMDSIEASILNEGGPSRSMDVSSIIEVLNSQNQASLKTVATVIGRGNAGVNTASVEARVFSLSADSLNGPIADLFSDMFTLALRLTGYLGHVECKFDRVEMRPETELEAHYTMRQARLLENLSLGLITDDEYHIQMFGRPKPAGAPDLQGTGFMANQKGNGGVDAGGITPNSDPLGKSVAAKDSKSAKSSTIKKS